MEQAEAQREAGAAGEAQGQDQQVQPPRKVKISFDEYQRISTLVVGVMKEFEAQGSDNVQQSAIIDRMVQKLLLEEPQQAANEQYAIEASKKVQNIISYLITRENVLMISQDARIKNERYLCLNINVDLQNMNLGS